MKSLIFTFLRIVALVSLIIGLTVGSWLTLFHTQLGAQSLFKSLAYLTSTQFTYKNLRGTLAGGLILEDFELSLDTATLKIEQTDLSLEPFALLKGELHLYPVRARDINIQVVLKNSADQPEQPTERFSVKRLQAWLPFHLKIDALDAEHIDYHASSKPLHITRVSVTQIDSQSNTLVHKLKIESPIGHLFLNTKNALDLSWDLTFSDLSQWAPNLKGDLRSHGKAVVEHFGTPEMTMHFAGLASSHLLSWNDQNFYQLEISTKGTENGASLNASMRYQKHSLQYEITADKKDGYHFELKPIKWSHSAWGKMPAIQAKLHLKPLKERVTASFNCSVSSDNTFEGVLALERASRNLTGSLKGSWSNFQQLSKFYPELKKAKGEGHLNLKVGGTVSKPKFWGDATLRNASMPLKEYNTSLKIDALELHSKGDGILDIKGRGSLGNGPFTLIGTTEFKERLPKVTLNLQGTNMILSQTPEYYIVANPNLNFQLNQGVPEIDGDITIPEALIVIESFKQFEAPSSDVIIVKDKQSLEPAAQRPEKPYKEFKSKIHFHLGPKVQFKGYGLNTHLEGDVKLRTQPNKPVIAKGKIHLIKGRYATHSKKLNITRGSLTFAETPLVNPALDIRAEREVKAYPLPASSKGNLFDPRQPQITGKIKVGLGLNGTLKHPRLRMYSTPSMPEGDVLAYLFLDKPQRAASFTEGKLLYEAATQMLYLFGPQKNDVRPSLVEQFKLDKLELQSTVSEGRAGLETTVLVVGKQVSRRLYAEYSVGILDTASALQLSYMVGKNVTVETSASKNSLGADLLFTFEN